MSSGGKHRQPQEPGGVTHSLVRGDNLRFPRRASRRQVDAVESSDGRRCRATVTGSQHADELHLHGRSHFDHADFAGGNVLLHLAQDGFRSSRRNPALDNIPMDQFELALERIAPPDQRH